MQTSDDSSSSSAHRRRGQLPALAPRHAQSSSRGERSSTSSGRPPRLSHRSRAGCWTCRGRKVKCDEIHPRCGPCTRLNRECDWDHRWNFNDATETTQSKHSNVTTQGNFVWDPSARSSPGGSPVTRYDDLPAFSVLQTDGERERKAETQRPGTYGVVVTPESFYDLPEYSTIASARDRRMSLQSHSSLAAYSTRTSSLSRASMHSDPNTVVLDRFEDASPSSGSPFSLPPLARRPSLPESMYYLALSTSPPVPLSSTVAIPTVPPPVHTHGAGHDLISWFRYYVVQRLCQPQLPGNSPDIIIPGSTKDTFELESQRFVPLHHAMCAISSLNLAYGQRSNLETAMEHYHSALSHGVAHDDLLSDGVFLRHFLLFVYDICMPTSDDSSMWAEHLSHLTRIALSRHQQLGREPRGFIVWRICELDTYACLMGNGNCEFVRHVLQHNMLPSLDQQIPIVDPSTPYLVDEGPTFPAILTLRQNIMIYTAKLAQLAQTLRGEAASRTVVSPGAYARWQAAVAQAQNELSSAWLQAYPDYLPSEPAQAGRNMPPRVRYVFEQAYLLYQAATIYSRTSMFPHQRGLPVADHGEAQADTQRRALSVITVVCEVLEARQLEARDVVFPLFMAGYAALHADAKVKALELITALEATGIGKNTNRTRALLKVVYEEQRKTYDTGGTGMGDVDWLAIARERRLTVVNCGL